MEDQNERRALLDLNLLLYQVVHCALVTALVDLEGGSHSGAVREAVHGQEAKA